MPRCRDELNRTQLEVRILWHDGMIACTGHWYWHMYVLVLASMHIYIYRGIILIQRYESLHQCPATPPKTVIQLRPSK